MIFTAVIKPTHICNLACTYCYNDDVRDPVMRDETLERTIAETFAYARAHAPGRRVSFIWHGGEPMVAGRAFYEQACDLQRHYAGDLTYANSIQTNGVLINDAWLDLFARERFSLSVSIDGPKPVHDAYRLDKRGRGSFDRVMAAVESVQAAGLPLGVCVVISRANRDRVDELYDLLAARGLPFNVIPINKSGGAREAYDDVGLGREDYAEPWIRLYDRWFDADEDYVYCSDFVFKTRAIAAGRPADCVGLARCADTNISIDPVGDVYPCASLSGHADTRYGNILDADLATLMAGPVARAYRDRAVDPQCARCRWQHVCHGGCQARSYKFFGDIDARDYYCPSLFRVYEHIARRLDERGVPRADRPPVPAVSCDRTNAAPVYTA
ncbi:uncharacterized protein EV659_10128 [Rhodothalassium salexigens DSM 2132]|uniref:Radical SAM core domain-containing protein n=1 Tax=Rhodothalassium salexigens DSM 2132 TaxID=1188247 RepID=A0A4R2PSQ4_RHOSA|nr:dynobactin maturation radical SAM/SPASM protein DynA [Rhodothalassium salexigens]MBB4209969.1 uncharacterized protein [Rhodothalassium salexigens DSM 2132]MBK1637659.1 hypothetical protein [Rhodothalassium salexigens DSM 2132]TCP38134.1 uncharacterized protein EV659_10128 [Rhodothalassium salexigens DSM 2132]